MDHMYKSDQAMEELGPCPVCKKHPATMGSMSFLPFDGFVCSVDCGRKAQVALKVLYTSPTYRRAQDLLERHQKAVEKLEQMAVENAK